MENASLVALSRQLVLRRKMDVIANNVANMETTGFKRQELLFDEYKMPVARANTFDVRRDRVHSYVEDWITSTDFSEGTLETTGNPFDIAIQGDGFFVVQTPDGERYTRSGSFQLDSTGRLVTPDGNPVMSEGGEVIFEPNELDVVIGTDGTISTNEGVRGQLRLVTFAQPGALKKVGDNLFSGEGAQPATTAFVKQGTIELSNVVGVTEMTRLIEVSRSYEQVSRMINDQDDLRSRAINRLGDMTA